MARPINNDNVLQITKALNEANASEARGLSVPELVEITGLHRNTIDRIFKRPEYGFRQALNTSATGAVTWYHDFTEMMIHQTSAGEIVQPLLFTDEEKTKFLINNLMNALMVIDPTNKLIAAVGKEMLENEANKHVKSKRQKRDFFDWLVYPFKSDIIDWLTENKQAKTYTDKFQSDLEEGSHIRGIINVYLYRDILLWWNPENKDFRPEISKEGWEHILVHGIAAIMLAAYLRENDKSNNQESEDQSP